MAELRILPKPLVRRPDTIDNLEYLREFGRTFEDARQRTNALEGIIGYGSFVMSQNQWLGADAGGPHRMRMQFDFKYGDSKGITPVSPTGRIQFDEPGLWKIDAQARAWQTPTGGDNLVWLDIEARRANGELIRKQSIDYPAGSSGKVIRGGMTVEIPDELGCYAEVWCYSGKWRWFYGGADWTEFTLRKLSSNTMSQALPNPGEPGGNPE